MINKIVNLSLILVISLFGVLLSSEQLNMYIFLKYTYKNPKISLDIILFSIPFSYHSHELKFWEGQVVWTLKAIWMDLVLDSIISGDDSSNAPRRSRTKNNAIADAIACDLLRALLSMSVLYHLNLMQISTIRYFYILILPYRWERFLTAGNEYKNYIIFSSLHWGMDLEQKKYWKNWSFCKMVH